jgi:hypothetical protein
MIRELLDKLQPAQRKQLMCAFEQETAYYIELDDGIFVGVNVGPLKNLVIEDESGVWACGRMR